jgi:hypothetical protein
MTTRAKGIETVARYLFQYGFRHDASAGITRANEEYVQFSRFHECFPVWEWRTAELYATISNLPSNRRENGHRHASLCRLPSEILHFS